MFDPEFFPTPRDLAQTLCRPYFPAIAAGEITAILDPSAGLGLAFLVLISGTVTGGP